LAAMQRTSAVCWARAAGVKQHDYDNQTLPSMNKT